MPSKRHEELRGFAHRILSYMGLTDIRNEEIISIKLKDGKEKKYKIDIIGYNNGWKNYNCILVEVGSNNYDKINNLRLAGYQVMVIPYSEKEEEWQDENKLLDIMIKGNNNCYDKMQGLIKGWENLAEGKIKTIEEYENNIFALNKRIGDLKEQLNDVYGALNDIKPRIKKIIDEVWVPYLPVK